MKMYLTTATSLYLAAYLTSPAWAQWRPNVPVETRSIDDIHQAALSEQCAALNVAAGGDAKEYWADTIEGFTKRFPDIPLNLTTDLSKYHDSRIDRAFYEGNETIDIATLQTLHDFPRWKQQNRLLFYKPANFSDLINGEKDFDGAWLPIYTFGFGRYLYDSTKLNASDVPDSYYDMVDPKWKGKLILTQPNDDDAITYLFSIIVSKYGFEWFEQLNQNDVQWVRGTATPTILLSRGINDTTSQRVLTMTAPLLDGLSPLVVAKNPVQEEYMSWFQTAAIFKSTKCPETAKLFISWILSDEWQAPTASSTQTPLNHLNTISGQSLATNNNTQTQGFREFMLDRTNVEWWRLQFETVLGPAVGPDPNTIY